MLALVIWISALQSSVRLSFIALNCKEQSEMDSRWLRSNISFKLKLWLETGVDGSLKQSYFDTKKGLYMAGKRDITNCCFHFLQRQIFLDIQKSSITSWVGLSCAKLRLV